MTNDSNREEIQPTSATQFTHSIKVEETAKGLRIHVHVYMSILTNRLADDEFENLNQTGNSNFWANI
jgi:hypothetical protein